MNDEEEDIQGDIDFLLTSLAGGSKGYVLVIAHGDGSIDTRSHGLNVYEEAGVMEMAKVALLLSDDDDEEAADADENPS
jgi:hypothetical protein